MIKKKTKTSIRWHKFGKQVPEKIQKISQATTQEEGDAVNFKDNVNVKKTFTKDVWSLTEQKGHRKSSRLRNASTRG